jgi:hypothetical protein
VVSFTNAAVENVREKLDGLGFGHVVASLGRKEKREEFFAGQAIRNARVTSFAEDAPPAPPAPERMDKLDRRLRGLQEDERTRAELRRRVDAYRLELQHFVQYLQRHEAPDLEGLPLLRRSSTRILDYLAESEVEHDGTRPGLLRRIRNYFRYGSLRGLDPDDTTVVLGLQRAYYDKRIAELEGQLKKVEDELRGADFDRLVGEHQELSIQALSAALGARYKPLGRTTYTAEGYRLGTTFTAFTRDYPVLLSTCHSLRASIANGYLLDHLIIDEASQVDLLAAGLALSCCRNVVVVGDLRQLPHIANEAADGLVSPKPAYDYREHNILSSLTHLYRDDLPRTRLREHYRCDPAIIGFCNKAFYGGELIPFTTSDAKRPMIVVRTVEGNHMRQHRGGGRSNQREVDVIVNEVIPAHCADVLSADIGITTPYRRQVDKLADARIDQIESDTVHKFQGRQKQVVILTTVLDEGWRGRTGLTFVDDPRKINVAVSRAVRRFILVTNHAMLPTSRHIRDLIGYIRYLNSDEEVVDSAVISMFDLLYRDYNDRLRPLAARLKNEMTYRSEDIIWTALHDILAEHDYAHLTVGYQVLVRNLLVDLSRLTPRQEAFVQRRASVDFVVYNQVTNRPLLAIEVDGFAFHENNPAQLERDAIKDEILRAHQMPVLRLATTGSGEDQRIREALNVAEARSAQMSGLRGGRDSWSHSRRSRRLLERVASRPGAVGGRPLPPGGTGSSAPPGSVPMCSGAPAHVVIGGRGGPRGAWSHRVPCAVAALIRRHGRRPGGGGAPRPGHRNDRPHRCRGRRADPGHHRSVPSPRRPGHVGDGAAGGAARRRAGGRAPPGLHLARGTATADARRRRAVPARRQCGRRAAR